MTGKRQSHQEQLSRRAVWVARAESGPDAVATESQRRGLARRVARVAEADLVGEFLFAVSHGEALSEDGWRQLVALLIERRAADLVALDPWEIADESAQFARRVAELEQRGVRLVGLLDATNASGERGRAA